MEHGTVAGYPVKDVRVRLVDGKHHDVDSSEMAFKIAGSMAFKQAMEDADPVLLEPIVRLTVSCPDEVVGDVIGDLNSRRGHPLGMEPKGSATEVKAEVPMAEVLDYAPDLRAISGGRADFEIEFERYDEVPCAPGPRGWSRQDQAERERSAPSRAVGTLASVSLDEQLAPPPRASAVDRFNDERPAAHRGRPDAHSGQATGLDRRRRRVPQRGADHGRLGALLVPVGRRHRRRARCPVFELGKGGELTELDGSARVMERRRRRAAAASSSARAADAAEPHGAAAASSHVKVVVNVDGGARGNPGPAAIAAVVQEPDGEVLEETRRADRHGDQQRRRVQGAAAGYREGGGARRERARAGRRLGADRAPGEGRIQGQGRDDARAARRGEERALSGFERWSIRHVRREQNAEADRLVNEVLDGGAERDPRSGGAEPIDPGVDIGHVHLKVADIDRALDFYCGVLGFELQQRFGDEAAFVSAGGYHHHIGLNTWHSKGGSPPPPGTTGLFHLAIRYPTRRALADALRRLLEAGVPLERRLRPRRQRGALPRRPRRQRHRALLGPAARGVAAPAAAARGSRCRRARSTSAACSASWTARTR